MSLLEDFDIEMMTEEERDDPPHVRSPKHWQLFHVVARKHAGQLPAESRDDRRSLEPQGMTTP